MIQFSLLSLNMNYKTALVLLLLTISGIQLNIASAHRHNGDHDSYQKSQYEREEITRQRTREQEERMDDYVKRSQERADRLLNR